MMCENMITNNNLQNEEYSLKSSYLQTELDSNVNINCQCKRSNLPITISITNLPPSGSTEIIIKTGFNSFHEMFIYACEVNKFSFWKETLCVNIFSWWKMSPLSISTDSGSVLDPLVCSEIFTSMSEWVWYLSVLMSCQTLHIREWSDTRPPMAWHRLRYKSKVLSHSEPHIVRVTLKGT